MFKSKNFEHEFWSAIRVEHNPNFVSSKIIRTQPILIYFHFWGLLEEILKDEFYHLKI